MVAVVDCPNFNKPSLKRSFFEGKTETTLTSSKRICLTPSSSRRNSAAGFSFSSSDEDDDSDNEAGYLNNQRKAKRRANSMKRSLSFADPHVKFAVSKYEDKDKSDDQSTNYVEDDYRYLNSPPASRSYYCDSKKLDRNARNRCFDYLNSAIDAAWARYCDSTSYDENKAYEEIDYLPNTPASLGPSEYENDDDEASEEEEDNGEEEEEEEDNEDEIKVNHCKDSRSEPTRCSFSDVELKKVSSYPRNVELQKLKNRLINTKDYLQGYLDTNDPNDAITFWRRWDLVKYTAIELVEDDDDDDDDKIIDETIDELEDGRLYGCF